MRVHGTIEYVAMKKRSSKKIHPVVDLLKNKKVVLHVVIVILILGAFALGRDSGMRGAGTANLYDAIYPPADPYTNYTPPIAPIYPPADAGTAPIYPPTVQIYPPADPNTAYVPPTDPIYPPADAGTAPIYPPTAPIYPPTNP